ncbi:siderophore ABC transporter substrate-binding protein [Agrococcus casei]|uniref:Petrobactin ABC transporter, periplasmic binding protein n=2 Tax=Agrococcus TaxID=46352 RepID=A0A1R4FLH3_9MICO|nr:ABC transporter substrate-binding protein [Agrococcus casei]SJM56681.1 Petrobactin ABC transporter, periplasmic binding protein [Agrococcus casei LMG 22410]
MSQNRSIIAVSALAAAAVALTGCATGTEAAEAPQADTITVEDNSGQIEVPADPTSVIALDNRSFETLDAWGIELSAAAVSLMPDTIGYTTDESLIDIGNHREPDLEQIVAVQPDLIISGQRFSQFNEQMAELAPDAVIVDLEPREGEPFADELKRQITVLGEIFDKQDEASAMVADFDAAIDRAAAAYDSADTVMALNASGGELGYLAPGVGRTLGPVFDILALTPALEVADASDDHQGDDISVEAVADSNPDWILVMDRDAAVSADDPEYSPAASVIEDSEALARVSAVEQGQIVYMPADTYTNEGLQTYTEFFNDFADALEAAK